MEINSENIKFSIVDNNTIFRNYKGKNKIPCYMEIRVTREFFHNFFYFKKLRLLKNSSKIHNISVRELEVLKCMYEGKNTLQIAKELNVSLCTAKAHISSIYTKFNTHNRTSTIIKAIKDRIIRI